MVSPADVLRFTSLLVELRDSADYLPAAASELQRMLECDEVVWVDADLPGCRFTMWRASSGSRDTAAERIVRQLFRHPAVESYMRDPLDLTPRRDCDVAELTEPEHLYALELSQQMLGRYQLSMVTRVDPVGLGRGWIGTRERREFDEHQLEVASRLLPVLLVLDRVQQPALESAPEPDLAEHPAWKDLTIRERQVVDLLATGLTAPAIGRTLGISARTVAKHLEHVYRKLGQHDRLLVAQSIPWRRETLAG